MEIRILSARDVRRALPMPEAIEAMRAAFRALHDGEVEMPARLALEGESGTMLFMPARLAMDGLGQKVVSVFPDNAGRGLPTIHALVTLYDAESGRPLALIEGGALTALRTGAVTGLATDLLARPDARNLTIFGAGAQAPDQIAAVLAVRPVGRVQIVSRGGESARALATRLEGVYPDVEIVAMEDRELAVRSADIVVAVTTTTTPLFDGRWVRPGTHVTGAGSFRPDMREVDAALLRRAAVVVDQREAAMAEAGELIGAVETGGWSWSLLYAELAELVGGEKARPANNERISYFKSCGLAIEDIAAARAVLRTADELGLGTTVEL